MTAAGDHGKARAEQGIGASADRSARVLREQTGLLLRQAGSGVAAATVGALLLAVPLLRSVPFWAYAIWFACLCSGYGLRQHLMEAAWRQGSLDRVRRIALIASAVLGLVVTAPAPLFYPMCTSDTRALISMIQLVWVTAAISVLAVFPLSYKLYSACALLSISLGWWLSAPPADAGLVTAFMVPLWLLLARFSDRVGHLIEESVDIRHERERLVQRLEGALADLEEANASRSRFLAAASHDLLQPVHALLLLTGLSRDLREGPRLREVHEQMHTVAGSIESMFRGLLDQARFEARTLQPSLQLVSVSQLLHTIQVEYEERCATKGIALRTSCESGLALRTDPSMSARVLRNLVDNAVKFTLTGSVELRAEREDDAVAITVSDSGVGISPEDMAHVRNPFYRGSAAREIEVPGVGLGLATASQMVQVLDGHLSIESSRLSGTTVKLLLPAAPAGDRPAAIRPPAPLPLRFQVVALIEDNRQARDAMALWLQENGCEVAAAADAQAVMALCEARHIQPEFVLADYSLGPDGTGIDAIRTLRSRYGAVPAAIVSGDPLRPETFPADIPWLKKPVNPDALKDLLQASHHG